MAKNEHSSSGIFIPDGFGNDIQASGHVDDLTGMVFGRLTVIGLNKIEKGIAFWNCLCKCGHICVIRSNNLKQGIAKSCGCYKKEVSRQLGKKAKHGMSQTRIYHIWKNMRRRCNCETAPDYDRYGGRGISVCNEWDDFQTFYDWAIENGYAPKLTIERIDNDGNYSPQNCKWATNTEQQRNRSKTVKLAYNGETKALSEWCEIYGLNMKTVYGRLHDYKWTNPDEILFGKGV